MLSNVKCRETGRSSFCLAASPIHRTQKPDKQLLRRYNEKWTPQLISEF